MDNKTRCKLFYENNREEQKRKARQRRQDEPVKHLLIAIKSRSRVAGVPFEIDESHLPLPTHCPILGIPLVVGGKLRDDSPSVDKIIPSLGYVPGNVAIISMKANRMKSDSSVEDLRKIINYIEDRQAPPH